MSQRNWRLLLAVWSLLALSLLASETGRSLAAQVSARRVGLVSLSAFLILLPRLSGIIAKYGTVHFIAALWVLIQAIVYGGLLGAPSPIAHTIHGVWILFGIALLVRFGALIREHHRRRMYLCDEIERALLSDDLAAVAAYHGHLRAHLAGYGT